MADEAHISVEVAYHCAQQVRDLFHQATPTQGQRLAAHLIERLPACPIPKIARLGRTLRKWKDVFLAYFDTGGAGNEPTEAINGIIELGRHTAKGYRNPTNHQLRMLLIAGGLDAATHTQLSRAGKPRPGPIPGSGEQPVNSPYLAGSEQPLGGKGIKEVQVCCRLCFCLQHATVAWLLMGACPGFRNGCGYGRSACSTCGACRRKTRRWPRSRRRCGW